METKNHKAEDARLTRSEQRSLGADATKFRDAWGRAARGDIKAKYAVGEKALAVEKKFGRAGVAALATAINRSVSYVYSYAAVVKTWARKQLGELLDRAAGSVEWSHLVLLSNKKQVDAQRRANLLTKIIAERMKPSALKLELYPAGATAGGVDPNLVDDGLVEEEGGTPEVESIAVEAAEGDGPDATAADVEAPESEAGDEEEPVEEKAHGAPPSPKGRRSLTGCAKTLRRFANELSTFAGQAELVDSQVFDGFEEAMRVEAAAETIDATLEDLERTKEAAAAAARFNQTVITKCNALIDAAKAKIAQRMVGQPPASVPFPVQMSGTPAGA